MTPNLPHRRLRAGSQKPDPFGAAKKTSAQVVDIETRQAVDAFQNALARIGFGTSNLLEGTAYPLTRLSRNYILMQSLYRTNWIARKVVDCIAEDMVKNWIEISSEIDPEEIDQFNKLIDNTVTQSKLLQAIKWARLFGGAGAVIIIEGQEDRLDEPLDIEEIELGAYKGLLVFDRWSGITPGPTINTDITKPEEFGLPTNYMVSTEAAQTFYVHASRVLRFTGRDLPQWEWQAEQRWGISEYEVIWDELKKRDNTSWNLASLIFRANIFALKQKDLNQMLSGINANAKVQQNFYSILQAQTQLMSNQGLMVLPEDGGLETHSYSFGGINDVYVSFMLDICGACEIPMSRLFGRTVTGLATTNEGDEHSYYDLIGQKQKRELQPQLRKLLPIIAMSLWGEVPEDFDWQMKPVRTMSNEEKAELAAKETTAVVEGFNAGIYGRQTALKEFKQISEETSLFSNITDKMIDEAEDDVPSEMDMGDLGAGGLPSPTGEIPATPTSKPKKGKATDTALVQMLKKRDVQFEMHASGEDYCELCTHVDPPKACKIVSGLVLAHSWCNRFEHKNGAAAPYGALDIFIENDIGTVRRGVDKDGEPWETLMTYPYGYIKRTKGTDGDEVDCFIGPFADSKRVYVIHTQDPDTLKYDEDKVMLGWRSAEEATAALEENYDCDGHFQSVEAMSMDDFVKNLKRFRGRKIRAYDEFKESEHPRKGAGQAGGGQFTSGGAGGGAKTESPHKPLTKLQEAYSELEKILNDPSKQHTTQQKESMQHALRIIQGNIHSEKEKEFLKANGAELKNKQEELIAEKEKEGAAEKAPEPPVPSEKKSPSKSGLSLKEITSRVNSPETKAKIIEAYKSGKSTGSISTDILDLPADNYTRYAIRQMLRKEKLYKEPVKAEKPPAPKASVAPVSSIQNKAHEYVNKYAPSGNYAESTYQGGLNAVKAYFKDLGISNGQMVSKAIQSWTGSSHSEGAQKWKHVALKYYNKPKAAEPKLTQNEDPTLDKGVLAMKAYTKAYVEKFGKKEVYRGMSGDVAKQIKEQLQAGKKEITFQANVLSSWSTSKAKAKGFAGSGVVLKMKVDPEHVWASYDAQPYAFAAHPSEQEYVMGYPGAVFKIPASNIEIASY